MAPTLLLDPHAILSEQLNCLLVNRPALQEHSNCRFCLEQTKSELCLNNLLPFVMHASYCPDAGSSRKEQIAEVAELMHNTPGHFDWCHLCRGKYHCVQLLYCLLNVKT